MNKIVHIGMDVGSTTVKIVVMDEDLKKSIHHMKDIIQIQKIQYVKY